LPVGIVTSGENVLQLNFTPGVIDEALIGVNNTAGTNETQIIVTINDLAQFSEVVAEGNGYIDFRNADGASCIISFV